MYVFRNALNSLASSEMRASAIRNLIKIQIHDRALRDNGSLTLPGRVNRIMNAVVPAPVVRSLMAGMFEKRLGKSLAGTDVK